MAGGCDLANRRTNSVPRAGGVPGEPEVAVETFGDAENLLRSYRGDELGHLARRGDESELLGPLSQNHMSPLGPGAMASG